MQVFLYGCADNIGFNDFVRIVGSPINYTRNGIHTLPVTHT